MGTAPNVYAQMQNQMPQGGLPAQFGGQGMGQGFGRQMPTQPPMWGGQPSRPITIPQAPVQAPGWGGEPARPVFDPRTMPVRMPANNFAQSLQGFFPGI